MKNKNDMLWGWSLIIIGVATLIISISGIMGIALPDMLKRILGILELISLPILVYTTIRKNRKNEE